MGGQLTRRAVLHGATALAAAVAAGSVGGCSGEDAVPAGVRREEGTLTSRHWPGRQVRWVIARPAATGAGSPVVVALHGYGGQASSAFDEVHLDRHVRATGLAVASVDGGNHYWHRRRSGVDTGALVVDDLVPLLQARGLDTRRVGLLGWSMGGYGALLLACQLGAGRVFGVVAESAALWLAPGDSAPGAFDDRADFERHDVFRRVGELRGIPVRLDCGTSDSFLGANRAFARRLPTARVGFDPGGHTMAYWSGHAAAQLDWLRAHTRSLVDPPS